MAAAASVADPLSGLQHWLGICGLVAQLFGAAGTPHLPPTLHARVWVCMHVSRHGMCGLSCRNVSEHTDRLVCIPYIHRDQSEQDILGMGCI